MKLRHKLTMLMVVLVLLPIGVTLSISQIFFAQTRSAAVEQTKTLAAANLAHIVRGAAALAESNLAAQNNQRQATVKNYLRAIADDLVRRTSALHASLPEEQALEQIRQAILGARIGQTGYAFGMNSAGVLTIHPSSEGKDLSGAGHIDRMRSERNGFVTYHSITADRFKAVYFRSYEPLDLILAPGVFLDEMEALYDRQAEQALWQRFRERLDEIRVGQSGSVWVLDAAQKSYVVAPDGSEAQRHPQLAEILERSKASAGGEVIGISYQQPDSGRRIVSRFTYLPSLGWVIGADGYADELFASSRQIEAAFGSLKSAVGVASVLIILLSVLLGLAFARRTTAPLRQACDFAREVAGGDLRRRLAEGGRDEVGDLSRSLNHMVGELTGQVRRTQLSAAELMRIDDKLADASRRVVEATDKQFSGIEETSSALQEINHSTRQVREEIASLSQAAQENNASLLELVASIEQVTANMDGLAQSGEQVTSSITEMTASIGQVSESADQLKAASDSTVSSVAEMDASIQQVEKSAVDAAAITERVRHDAEGGQRSVEATVAGIHDITTAMRTTSEAIHILSGQTSNIGNIVSIILDVASEIDLLALNAAIIAAQAGERGRAFSVVAEEIKELATRTSDSSREIAEVIRTVQAKIDEAAGAIDQAEQKTLEGEELSRDSGRALAKIVAGIEQATEQVASIAKATAEQANGSRMIRQAMEKVAVMASQIATATGEQEKGAELVMGAAERMKDSSVQIHHTTREQNQASMVIARNTEGMAERIGLIERACDEQVRSSDMIVRAMEGLSDSARTTREATGVLNEGVAGLIGEVDLLQESISAFRVNEQDLSAEGTGQTGQE